MGTNIEGLIEYSRKKKEKAIQKVDEAIRNLSLNCKNYKFLIKLKIIKLIKINFKKYKLKFN